MISKKPVLFIALGQIIIWAGMFYVFPANLVRWEQSLGWSKSDLTGAITLGLFASAVASPLAGRFIDRNHGPLLMGLSAAVGGVILYSLSLVTMLWQFYLAWGLIGVCFAGCLYEPCFAVVTRARGEHAKQSIILITLIAGFAGSISFPMAYSLGEAMGWRSAIRIFAVAVVFIGAPILWLGARSLQRDGEVTHKLSNQDAHDNRYSFLRAPSFWLLGIGFALLAMIHGVILHHLLPILAERKISTETAVLVASFIGPMQVAGRLAMMAAEKQVSNHGIAKTCFIVLGIAVILLAVSGASATTLVGFVIMFGGSYGIVSIIRPVIARDILGQTNFGAKSGSLALLYLLGSASAPFLGSLIWQLGGYTVVLQCLLIMAAVGLGLYILADRFRRRFT